MSPCVRILAPSVALLLCACAARALPEDDASDAARRVYTQVASGMQTVCALVVGGQLRCWGKPLAGVAPKTLVQVSVGDVHACGIDADAVVRCWGDNRDDALMPPQAPAIDVVASPSATIAIVGGAIKRQHIPLSYSVPKGTSFRSLMTWPFCAIDAAGIAHCWGPASYPYQIPNLRLVRIASRNGLLCGILSADRQLICWDWGSLAEKTFHLFDKDPGWRWLDGYVNYVCAIDAAGRIHCDGLGDPEGFGDPPLSVTKPPGGAGYVRVSTGHYQACALHEDGHIDCWGENDHGQLNVPAR